MFTQHRANFRWARKFALTLGSHADCSIFSRCVHMGRFLERWDNLRSLHFRTIKVAPCEGNN